MSKENESTISQIAATLVQYHLPAAETLIRYYLSQVPDEEFPTFRDDVFAFLDEGATSPKERLLVCRLLAERG